MSSFDPFDRQKLFVKKTFRLFGILIFLHCWWLLDSAGIMIFATVLGYVANIVSNISAARKDFQGRYVDCIQCILARAG